MSYPNPFPTISINHADICEMIDKQSFWVEYEPIIDMRSGDIYGYEALARFVHKGQNIPPTPILHVAHQTEELFFRLEKELKRMQVKHRPQEGMLFVNIDPHNFKGEERMEYWHEFFLHLEDICIEVTENTDTMETGVLSDCLVELKKTGLPIAQDDIGNDKKPFCFELTKQAQFLKFDRSWLHKVKTCSDYQEILKGFLSFAKLQHKMTILEGVEEEEDFVIAKALGVDFVQGYLFKYLNLTSKEDHL